jgi:hypothetical protein
MNAIYWIPVATTIVAAGFSVVVLRRYRARGGAHLLWWGIRRTSVDIRRIQVERFRAVERKASREYSPFSVIRGAGIT